MKLNSLEEVLRFAIRKEADAAAFYQMAADRSNPGVKKMFKELAREEEGHKKKLEDFDLKKLDRRAAKEAKGLGIAELMEDVSFSSDMSYADLLRMAIKNEERSEQLYVSAARTVEDATLKKLLLSLAKQETGHKKRLETIYDDDVLEEF